MQKARWQVLTSFLHKTKRLTQVLNTGLGSFADDDLDAVVTGLGGGVLLAAADNFAVGGDVVEAILTGL